MYFNIIYTCLSHTLSTSVPCNNFLEEAMRILIIHVSKIVILVYADAGTYYLPF